LRQPFAFTQKSMAADVPCFFKLSYRILFCYFSAATTPGMLCYRFTDVELKN